MKKILSFSLAVLLVLAMAISAQAAPEGDRLTRGAAVQKIVKALYTTDGGTDFSIADNYSVDENGNARFDPADAAKSYPIMCELYDNVDGSGFTDVSSDNENALYISLAKAMGIVNGMGDNTFAPNSELTYNQAVKMIVSIIGYGGQLADAAGGYPEGYVSVAKDLGIAEGLTFQGTDAISQEDFDLILSRCLEGQYSPLNVAIADFTPAATPELCAETYARAVQERNGAVQYALMDSGLRSETRSDFVGFNWVSGMSSPWVESYDVSKTGDLAYDITFHYATSTGPAGDSVVHLGLKQVLDYYQITSLDDANEDASQ